MGRGMVRSPADTGNLQTKTRFQEGTWAEAWYGRTDLHCELANRQYYCPVHARHLVHCIMQPVIYAVDITWTYIFLSVSPLRQTAKGLLSRRDRSGTVCRL